MMTQMMQLLGHTQLSRVMIPEDMTQGEILQRKLALFRERTQLILAVGLAYDHPKFGEIDRELELLSERQARLSKELWGEFT